MSIKSYRRDEKVYWKVYVNLRNKMNPLMRKQKTVSDLESLAAARRMEKQIVVELSTELALEMNQGVSWEKVLERWEKDARAGVLRRYDPSTISDTVAGLKKWTVEWLKTPAENLTRANGRDIQRYIAILQPSLIAFKLNAFRRSGSMLRMWPLALIRKTSIWSKCRPQN